MEQSTLEEFKTRLTEEREELIHQLKEMGVDPETGAPDQVDFEHGFADSAHATAEKANLLSIAEGLCETLNEVKIALTRIEEGKYGTCERCGTEIPVERLEARPHARLCMQCKQAG